MIATMTDLDLDRLLTRHPWLSLVTIAKDDDASGGADDDTDDDVDDDEDESDDDTDDADEDDDAKGKKAKPTFTQAAVDRLVGKARREERRRLRAKADKAKGGDSDKGDDGDDDVKALRSELAELKAERERDKVLDAARSAAVDADVDPKKVRRFLKLADLDGIKPDDTDAIEDAIADALDENPEFRKADEDDDGDEPAPKRKRAKRTSRDTSNGKGERIWTRADIEKAAKDGTYEKYRDEIQAQAKAGKIK